MHKSNAIINVRVKVPATSANMGPGFDSLGIALGLYNIINISEEKGEGNSELINNLIYRAMNRVFDECGYVPGKIRIWQSSRIPMTRGLGSSSACIIGGMLGANVLAGRPFNYGEILNMAAEIEGHPDNVTPALFGGFCTAAMDGKKVLYTSNKIVGKIKLAAIIPNYFVATKNSRGILPEIFSKSDAVFNISHAAMLTSALISGKTELLKASCDDRMHQSYRKQYIDGYDEIFEKSYSYGSLATYLSGSGPTVIAILDENCKDFTEKMNNYLKENHAGWTCRLLTVDNVGAVVSTFEKKQKNWRF